MTCLPPPCMPALAARDIPVVDGFPIVFLPPSLYDAAKARGFDMRSYRKQEPIPELPGSIWKLA